MGEVPVAELMLRRLLPVAHAGLEAWGVDAADRERLLGIIEQRCLTAQRRRVAGGDLPPPLRGDASSTARTRCAR